MIADHNLYARFHHHIIQFRFLIGGVECNSGCVSVVNRLVVNRSRPFKVVPKKLAPRPELECPEIESFPALFYGRNFGLRFDGKVKWAWIPPSNSGRIRIGSLIVRRYRLSFKGHRYLCLPPPRVCRTLAKAIGKSGKGSAEEIDPMRYIRSHLVQNGGNYFAQNTPTRALCLSVSLSLPL